MAIERMRSYTDLKQFVGGLLALELDGKSEDLPLTIGSFKVIGCKPKVLIGYDEENRKLQIPAERIVYYMKYK